MWKLFDLSVEIAGISAMVSGLSTQLDNNETDTITPGIMKNALYGIQHYLDRISSDLEALSGGGSEEKEDVA